MSAADIDDDHETLATLRAAGLSDAAARSYMNAERVRTAAEQAERETRLADKHEHEKQQRAKYRAKPAISAAHAFNELRAAGATESLCRAYASASAPPPRIVSDLIANLGPGMKLSALACATLEKRVKAEPEQYTPAAIWRHVRATKRSI